MNAEVNIPKISKLCVLLNSNSALISFTGLNNFEILSCLVSAVEKIVKDIRHTLIKLKLDLTYATLAIMFNTSGELCKKYILEMLPSLSAFLRSTVYFPSAEEIKKKLILTMYELYWTVQKYSSKSQNVSVVELDFTLSIRANLL